MKYLRYLLVIFLISLPVAAFAINVQPFRSFGGRIITAPVPGANCPTSLEPTSPFVILAVPLGSPYFGPFSQLPGPQTAGQLVPGAQILGNYMTIPIPDCFVGLPLVGQVPVFKAYMYRTDVPEIDPL